MGRENMEDYNADFLVMLESWEAAIKYCGRGRENPQTIDVAIRLRSLVNFSRMNGSLVVRRRVSWGMPH